MKHGCLVELLSSCTMPSGRCVLVHPDACNGFDIVVLANWLLEQARDPTAEHPDDVEGNIVPMYRAG
ncbi:hypothetical protein WT27_03940 [Burkholderia territorii]|uniref:Uncharacterized protein n=1 Tax=Burkholderia territorii TaxID=1503055 RepID=A0A119AU41_9BURK|nr:hypothetical protein [Burkholderia territorii]KVV48395.1 hypothetical protein WT27_03940 [Burkholderia territorii]KVX26725.1 hypothetical protein WT31_15700 [Burkholderia territorii]